MYINKYFDDLNNERNWFGWFKCKRFALNETIDYGKNKEYDIDGASQTDSEDNNDSYTSDSCQDMDVGIKNNMKLGINCEEKTPIINQLVQRNRDAFLGMLKN